MRLAVSSWSMRSHINKDFSLVEFPRVARERFGFDAVELCSMHFRNTDTGYLDEIKNNLVAYKIGFANMPIDTGNISQTDPEKRQFDLERIAGWMAVASYLGAEAVRVNTGAPEAGWDISITVDSYKKLAKVAQDYNMLLLIENHGGVSSRPEAMIQILEQTAAPNLKLCPDFGNFPDETRYEDLTRIMPYGYMLHAKTYDFDSAGNHPSFDFARCMQIAKDAGFRGTISVEFEGSGDQYDGVEKTLALVKKNL
jgi:sugar phosphate isomerase/epimerase